ncbi:MAG: hypothetical protein PVH48_03185 [Cyclobacteriaceae bacterium]|jgi:hypothetical protein
MRRVKNITMAVLVIVISTGWAMAQEVSTSEMEASKKIPESIQVVPEFDARYKLVYPIKKTEQVRIRIYDDENHLLLSENVENHKGFMKSYDFSNLSDGMYTINIQSPSGVISKEVYHRYQKDDIDFSVERNPDKESFRLVVSGVRKEPVFVDIMDENRERIYEDTIDVGKSFSRTYRFKGRVPENVLFRVSSTNSSLTKEVR